MMESLSVNRSNVEIIRIVLDIVLIVCIISIIVFAFSKYGVALGFKNPMMLIEMYGELTGNYCACGSQNDISNCLIESISGGNITAYLPLP